MKLKNALPEAKKQATELFNSGIPEMDEHSMHSSISSANNQTTENNMKIPTPNKTMISENDIIREKETVTDVAPETSADRATHSQAQESSCTGEEISKEQDTPQNETENEITLYGELGAKKDDGIVELSGQIEYVPHTSSAPSSFEVTASELNACVSSEPDNRTITTFWQSTHLKKISNESRKITAIIATDIKETIGLKDTEVFKSLSSFSHDELVRLIKR